MYSQLTRSNLQRAVRVGMNHTSQIYCTYVPGIYSTGILSDVYTVQYEYIFQIIRFVCGTNQDQVRFAKVTTIW